MMSLAYLKFFVWLLKFWKPISWKITSSLWKFSEFWLTECWVVLQPIDFLQLGYSRIGWWETTFWGNAIDNFRSKKLSIHFYAPKSLNISTHINTYFHENHRSDLLPSRLQKSRFQWFALWKFHKFLSNTNKEAGGQACHSHKRGNKIRKNIRLGPNF